MDFFRNANGPIVADLDYSSTIRKYRVLPASCQPIPTEPMIDLILGKNYSDDWSQSYRK